MKKIFVALALALSVAMAVPVSAAVVNLYMVDKGPQLGDPYWTDTWPYQFYVNGVEERIPLVCLDYYAPADIGDSFSAYVGNLSTPDLSHARFYQGDPDQLTIYREAAWLYGLMASNPSDIGAIQFAIWKLFIPGVSNPYEPGKTASYLAQALAAVPTFGTLNWSSVLLYTNDQVNSKTGYFDYQEFIRGTPAPIPIPAAAWLLGTGLVGLVALRRRKK